MPIQLNKEESLIFPEVITPAIKADMAWIQQVIINAPHNGAWTASIESHPFDGKQVYYRDAEGNDTVVRVSTASLQEDMAKDPSLVHRVETMMGLMISIAGSIKALRDTEKLEQAKT